MAIETTQWGPNTCSCRFQISWDNSLPDDQRTHNVDAVLARGDEHALLVDAGVHYQTCREESFRVSKAMEVAANGGYDTDLISYDFDPGRTLYLHVAGSKNGRLALQNLIATEVGIGLVVVTA